MQSLIFMEKRFTMNVLCGVSCHTVSGRAIHEGCCWSSSGADYDSDGKV